MSWRREQPDLARIVDSFDVRITTLEKGVVLRGQIGVGELRIGNYVIRQVGPNLVADSLVAPFTQTVIAVP